MTQIFSGVTLWGAECGIERRKQFVSINDPAVHSQIQDEQAALNATKLAMKMSKKYQRRLHILHLSTGIEIAGK